jgi:hypothetical protein
MDNPTKTSVAVTLTIAVALVTPLCGLWFSCGCDWPWYGLFILCDALVKNTPPPHCPWCVHPLPAAVGIAASLAAGAIAAWKARRILPNGCAGVLCRSGLGVAAFVFALLINLSSG